MSKKEIVLWLVLADFVALTAWAVISDGYFGFVSAGIGFASGSVWGAQIIADFLIALAVALGWVVADARRQGIGYWPYVALTFTLGSIGPLAYLIHRERHHSVSSVAATPVPEHA